MNEENIKEVCILGKGPTRVECPYDKETWAVNDSYDFAKRVDKLFLTDVWSEFSIPDLRDAQKKHGCELISATLPPDSSLPVTLYPIEEILQEFKTRFFTNTICYMLAYAIWKGYKRIWFYGIDMLTHTTYITEKGGVEYWMGVANGRGVEIINTSDSATGKTYDGRFYGHWGDKKEKMQEMARSFP